jgi:hypothetical protein
MGMRNEGTRLVASGFVSVMGEARKLNFNISEVHTVGEIPIVVA